MADAAERIDTRELKVRRAYNTGYRSGQATAIAGITYRQLDSWDRIKLISPTHSSARGSGHGRVYSVLDVVLLKLVKNLTDCGLRPGAIASLVTHIRALDDVSGKYVVIRKSGAAVVGEVAMVRILREARDAVTVAAIPDPDEVAMT